MKFLAIFLSSGPDPILNCPILPQTPAEISSNLLDIELSSLMIFVFLTRLSFSSQVSLALSSWLLMLASWDCSAWI